MSESVEISGQLMSTGPERSFSSEPTGGFSATGFSVSEIVDLLAAQREHLRLTADLARELSGAADAVRYTPGSPA